MKLSIIRLLTVCVLGENVHSGPRPFCLIILFGFVFVDFYKFFL